MYSRKLLFLFRVIGSLVVGSLELQTLRLFYIIFWTVVPYLIQFHLSLYPDTECAIVKSSPVSYQSTLDLLYNILNYHLTLQFCLFEGGRVGIVLLLNFQNLYFIFHSQRFRSNVFFFLIFYYYYYYA